ncbi:hypothetical protein V8C42DRAFT_358797 [Trichoderma barbatum]
MSIAENSFSDNTTIHHENNVYDYSSDGANDRCLADWRSTQPRNDRIRIEQVKGGLFRFIQLERKGKTMLTCGIIGELANQTKIENPGSKIVLSYFFCQGLSQIVIDDLQDTSINCLILVIDALDKCENDQLSRLLPVVTDSISEQKMRTHGSRALLSLVSKENEACVSHAVDAYIKHSVSRLDLVRDDKVLQDDPEKAMRRKVYGTFLWVIDEIPSDLKKLYARMMDQIPQLKRETPMYRKQLLSTVCATHRPICLSQLGGLRRLPAEAFQTIFPGGVEKYHHSLFSRSLQGMSETLRRDFWDLNAPGALIDETIVPGPDSLATTHYSCGTGIIHQFLNKRYLYWLEALSLQRSISHSVTALNKLEALIHNMETNQIIQLVGISRDARRFILTHGKVIEIALLQPIWIASKPVMDAKRGPCLQTLEGHEDAISSVACPADDQRLAIASRDKVVKIWDYLTGASAAGVAGIWNLNTCHISGYPRPLFAKSAT